MTITKNPNLVAVQKMVVRDGKPHMQTYYVSPKDAAVSHVDSVKVFELSDNFRQFCKSLTTEQRQQIMDSADQQGIPYTKTATWKTTWMQCAMGINKYIKAGNSFTLQPFKDTSKNTTKDSKNTQLKKESKPKKDNKQATKDTTNNTTKDRKGTTNMNTTKDMSKIDQLYTHVGLKVREENGTYIVGEGIRTVKNKWGYDEIAPGHVRFVDVTPMPKFGEGNWIRLDSSFFDKDKLKDNYGARWEPSEKKWYIPFKEFVRVSVAYKNFEIDASITPLMKEVMNKIPDVTQLVSNTSQPSSISVKDDIDISDFKMPKGMNEKLNLYDHQKKGVKFLLENRRATAGLAVGLGKTLTAVTGIKELINRKEISKAVVVCPSSVKFNWKQEIENFSDMKATVLESSDLNNATKAEKTWKAAEKSQVLIVNYEMLRKPEIREQLQKLAPNCVIADEAHKLKNDTKQTRGFTDTWKHSKYKWFLTATPFPNGQPKETYNMLRHLRPDKVGTWKRDFGRQFVIWQSGAWGAKAVALKNLDKLREKMNDVVFIRTHNSPDVTSTLPKERHSTYNLEMTKEQTRMYKAVANDILSELKSLERAGIKASAPVVLAKMKRLEQISIDPDMLQTDSSKINMSKLYPKEEWAVNTIVEHLQDADNGGVVVFCDMKLPLDKVRQGLIDNKLDASKIGYITGDVKPEDRTKVQEKMKTGEMKVVLCTSAGEEGVNLQHGAHTMIHLDVPWTPKSITQREGRVLRQGQTNEYASFLTPIMAGTVEDTKRSKIGVKVSTIEELLGKGSAGSAHNNVQQDASAEKLTLADIKAIMGV